MAKATTTPFRGIQGLSIEDECLQAVILPTIGGKMTSLKCKASGREWLWQDPGDLLRFPPYGAPLPDYDIGGFQECFPTVNEVYYPSSPWRGVVVPDHGEVWALPWEAESTDDGLHLWVYSVRFAYRLDKWLHFSDDGRLTIRYELRSLAPFDFKYLWSAHPALNLQPGMKLLLPPGTRLRSEFSDHGRLGEMGALHEWPATTDAAGNAVDLSLVQTKAAHTHDKLNTAGLTAGWSAVVRAAERRLPGLYLLAGRDPLCRLLADPGRLAAAGRAVSRRRLRTLHRLSRPARCGHRLGEAQRASGAGRPALDADGARRAG